VQPYIFFDGKCEEALDFYKSALGATVDMMMRFKESPDQSQMPASSGEKVMHAAFRVGGTQVLASDGHCAGKPSFQGFGLAERQERR
jgi:PhnB protein